MVQEASDGGECPRPAAPDWHEGRAGVLRITQEVDHEDVAVGDQLEDVRGGPLVQQAAGGVNFQQDRWLLNFSQGGGLFIFRKDGSGLSDRWDSASGLRHHHGLEEADREDNAADGAEGDTVEEGVPHAAVHDAPKVRRGPLRQ